MRFECVCVCVRQMRSHPHAAGTMCSSSRKNTFFPLLLSCLLRHFIATTHFQSAFNLFPLCVFVPHFRALLCCSWSAVFLRQIQPAILIDSLHCFPISQYFVMRLTLTMFGCRYLDFFGYLYPFITRVSASSSCLLRVDYTGNAFFSRSPHFNEMYRGIYGFVSFVVSLCLCLPLYTFDSLPDIQTKRLVDSEQKKESLYTYLWIQLESGDREDKKEALFPILWWLMDEWGEKIVGIESNGDFSKIISHISRARKYYYESFGSARLATCEAGRLHFHSFDRWLTNEIQIAAPLQLLKAAERE